MMRGMKTKPPWNYVLALLLAGATIIVVMYAATYYPGG